MDDEYGAALLSWLQTGVLVHAKADSAGNTHRKNRPHTCTRVRTASTGDSQTTEVPDYVRIEYMKKRKQAKARCAKARQSVQKKKETLHHLDANEALRERYDVTQAMWKERVAASKRTVTSLPSFAEDSNQAKRRTPRRRTPLVSLPIHTASPKLECRTSEASHDRNFMKAYAARRHGKVHASFFRDKLRFIVRENDRQELNQWHKEYGLKAMTERARDDLYLSVAADAKRLLAVKYPHFSAKALQLIVTSIHEEGQLARKKSKGGGFNPYGSEGPGGEKSENRPELAHTLKRHSPLYVVEGTVVPVGTSFVPMHTNGDGACSVHAAWGEARATSAGHWELWCEDARVKIRSLLDDDVQAVRASVNHNEFFDMDILSIPWEELFVPVMQGHGDSEGRAFVESLKKRNNPLFEQAKNFLEKRDCDTHEVNKKRADLRRKSREFFHKTLEAEVVRKLAEAFSLVPEG